MQLPFDLQRFASEAVTGVTVFVATQLPRAYRHLRARVAPNSALPELKFYAHRADLRIDSSQDGSCQMFLELVNLGSRDLHVEQFQISHGTVAGSHCQFRDQKATPPRLTVSARGVGHLTLEFRLDPTAINRVVVTALEALKHMSSPDHNIHCELAFVVERRFVRRSVAHRDVSVPVVRAHIAPPAQKQFASGDVGRPKGVA